MYWKLYNFRVFQTKHSFKTRVFPSYDESLVMKVELHSPDDEDSPLEKPEYESLDGKEELPDQDDMVQDR